MRYGVLCIALLALLLVGAGVNASADTTGLGTGSVRILSGIVASAQKKLPEIVFFSVSSVLHADFNSDGQEDDATIALAPKDMVNPDDRIFLIVHLADQPSPLIAEIPVNDEGLCSAAASLRLETQSTQRPVLVVDDGACDTFRFEVENTPAQLVVSRN